MLVRVSHRPPHQEDRDRKYQRFSDNPRKTQAFAAEPRIELANDQGADDPPLDYESSPKRRHQPCSPRCLDWTAACSQALMPPRRPAGRPGDRMRLAGKFVPPEQL